VRDAGPAPLRRARAARLAAALAAAAALASPGAAGAAAPRPITIDPLDAPIAAAPFLLDVNADIPLTGRAAPRAEVEVTARCSLRPCAMRVVANRRGRWKAKLHVVVPPHRTTLFVRAGPPLAEPTAERRVTLDPAPLPGGAPELALIGDSLAVGTGPHLPAALPGWRVTVDAVSGRVLWTGIGVLDTVRRQTRRPYALAFSLFTNDHPSRAAELATAARRSVAGLPRGSCALWATIARPRIDGVSYAAANRALEQVAREDHDGRRVVVVPWARAARRHPEWLRRDRVHATDEGYRARAALYAAAARRCGL
jgi:hypothetical protein